MNAFKICMVKENDIDYPDVNISFPQTVADLVAKYVGTPDREMFIVLAVNVRNKITGIHTVSVGSLDTSIVHPREVFKFAILANASSIIVAHNHPSGDTTPSSDDIELTKRLKQASEILAIDLLDHIVLGHDGQYLSFRDRGLF
jgi:DNA repair protein RadC